MVSLLRAIKVLLKLFVILIVLLIILTWQNNYARTRTKERFLILRKALENQNMKYILVWSYDSEELRVLKTQQDVFIENRCKYTNCYVTRERHFLKTVNSDFDAIILSRRNHLEDLPNGTRHPNQTFVYATQEPAVNYPICIDEFDNYFNLTWTYKLDSDIVWTHFTIFDKNGSQIAPSKNVNWRKSKKIISYEEGRRIMKRKKSAVIWVALNCYVQSKREHFVFRLTQALKFYGFRMHAVGDCGDRLCPSTDPKDCWITLERYYFYLALESSVTEDYVSENVAKALLHYSVPIVSGGANYSRFLPPGSYIDGRKLGPRRTAALMTRLIRNGTAYLQYFNWRNYYTVNLTQQYVCELCEWLNEGKRKTHPDLMSWWNGDNKNCDLPLGMTGLSVSLESAEVWENRVHKESVGKT